METKDSAHKIDKGSLSIISLFDQSNEKEYWLTKTPLERLEAVEIFRQRIYAYDPFTARLQRVLSVAELARR